MTDSINGFYVTLVVPLKDGDDDVEAIRKALGMVKGVIDVRPTVAGVDQMGGAIRRNHAWTMALLKIIQDGGPPA